jgi:SAM-dependent methyltransferase
MKLATRVRYGMWALTHGINPDTRCPDCGSILTCVRHRKWLVTSLHECFTCGLRFRVPKDTEEINQKFYQWEYEPECETTDYTRYLELLEHAGIKPPMSILDFGCGTGIGSRVLADRGYDVTGYDISEWRTLAAASRGIRIQRSADKFESLDCVFSAHTLEHMPFPGAFWCVAWMTLKGGGALVVVVPNGDPVAELSDRYEHLWGKVHPLVITTKYLKRAAEQWGFERCHVYDNRDGELQMIARRP